jgi:hypothetical protein
MATSLCADVIADALKDQSGKPARLLPTAVLHRDSRWEACRQIASSFRRWAFDEA